MMRGKGFRRRDDRRTVTYGFRFFPANFCACNDDLHHGQGLRLLVTGRFHSGIVIFLIQDKRFWPPWGDTNASYLKSGLDS